MANKTTYLLEVMLGATTSTSWKNNLTKAQNDLAGLNSVANKLIAGTAAAVVAGSVVIGGAISSATETFTGFEQEMATVQSISGANAQQFEAMREAALDAGRDTVYTAEESASAFEYMSLAGWDVEESLKGLNPILHLAAATQKDLQTTSDLVTDSMNALGLEVNNLDMYMDKLIASNNEANTTAEQTMQALVKTGGASRVLGASLDETITSIGILANNGLKAEEAGTALNSIFVRLAGNSTALKELDNIGVSLWDNGKFIGLEESLIAINEAMEGFTDEQKALSLSKIAGTRRYSQFSYLLDSVKQTTDEAGNVSSVWSELESEVVNSTGALERMYGIETDTLEMALARWKSAKEDMQIRVVDVFSDDAKEFLFWLSDELPNVTDSIVAFAEAHKGDFSDALEKAAEGLENLLENGVELGSWLIQNRRTVIGTLGGIAAGVTAIKVASTGMKIASILGGPLSTTLALATAAAAAFGALGGAIADAEREATAQSLADHFGDIALSFSEIENVASSLTETDAFSRLRSALDELSESDELSEKVADALSEINKLNWKVEVGLELTEEDKESYQKAVEDYVSNLNAYAEQERYAVSVSLAAGLEGSANSAEILTKVDEFYALNQESMQNLGTRLSDAVNAAFEDNVLSPEEIENIASIQAQISEAQAQMSRGRLDAQMSLLGVNYDWSSLDSESFIAIEEEVGKNLAEIQQTAQESYYDNYAVLYNAYNGGTAEGFNEAVAELQSSYKQQIGDAQLQAADALVGGIMSAYSDEGIQETIDSINSNLTGELETLLSGNYDASTFQAQLDRAQLDIAESVDLDSQTQKDLGKLYEELAPTLESLLTTKQQLQELGVEIPEEYQNAINNIRMIGAASGDQDAIYALLGDSIKNDERYTDIIAAAQGAGALIPESFMEGMTTPENMSEIESTTEMVRQKIKEGLENGTIDSTITINMQLVADVNTEQAKVNRMVQRTTDKLTGSMDSFPAPTTETWAGVPYADPNIDHNANGGIINSTELSWLAEDGPEAVIPLDGSENALSLWQRVGQLLGVRTDRAGDALAALSNSSNTSNGQGIQVNFSPNIVIQGNASKEEVSSALTMSIDQLREMLDEIKREDSRVSFA
ncbi:MAG: phage tail tape measure protein [Pseudobutyrivibrio ruminis]|nr:phage tail tape measure protein [Pseudobutyrivibrio ruminis]